MKKPLFSKLKNFVSLIRISQWIKNLFVFVPLIFSKSFFSEKLILSVEAFFIFSIASSISYIINDIFDIETDKVHPKKKERPIASGKVSKLQAIFFIVLMFVFLLILLIPMNRNFIIAIVIYLAINFLYSAHLKKVSILDILLISSGFMLRVIAGALAIDVYISSWLILTTLFLSLFLAINKRIAEIKHVGMISRNVLNFYSHEYLNQISGISTAGIIICYSMYTLSERTIKEFNTENLVFTTFFVVFGIFRYMLLVQKSDKGENIIETILEDYPSTINILAYIITILIIIY